MIEKTKILFLSANPRTTNRILVDEEAREILERIQEGPYVHFSGHRSKGQNHLTIFETFSLTSSNTQTLVQK